MKHFCDNWTLISVEELECILVMLVMHSIRLKYIMYVQTEMISLRVSSNVHQVTFITTKLLTVFTFKWFLWCQFPCQFDSAQRHRPILVNSISDSIHTEKISLWCEFLCRKSSHFCAKHFWEYSHWNSLSLAY